MVVMLLLPGQFIGKDWGDPGGVAVILASGTGRCTFGVAERCTGSGIRHLGRNAAGYSSLREVEKPLDDYFFFESVTEFVPRQIRVLYGK
jgi:hypothetical protein